MRDSLARNSLLIMATTVINGGLGYGYWMMAARSVPQSAVGMATALISAATAVSMIANLGAGHMFIQRLPGSDTGSWARIVSGGLILGAAATGAAATVVALVAPAVAENFGFLAGFGGAAALICAAVAITLTTLLDNVYVAHRAGQGMLLRNLALAAGKIVTLAVLAAGTAPGGSLGTEAVLISWTLPILLVSAVSMVTAPRRLRPGARLRPGGITTELPHLRTALTGHHLINLTQAGPAALLPVLVTGRLGPDANAHFYLAWMTASMLFMVSPAVASALYAERTNAARVSVSRAAAVVAAVVGLPAAVLLIAGDRILGLFSAGYADGGGPLLKILVVAALPDAITNLAVAHWRSRGEFRRCRRLNAVRAGTCLILTWLLLPGSGVTGAGVAWLAGQTASALLVALVALLDRPSTGARCCLEPASPAARRPPCLCGLKPPAGPERAQIAPDTPLEASRTTPAEREAPLEASRTTPAGSGRGQIAADTPLGASRAKPAEREAALGASQTTAAGSEGGQNAADTPLGASWGDLGGRGAGGTVRNRRVR
ncbi:lipopolysaccharide biosynthesis protein [Actinoplanes sp. GCM10030250]|uniref:lipopolysaccharide biosynthesis protein n=1 Tax=Actinoplanes sp. GCM10030250 TaxID=3273376 RepID=UPI00361FE113